MTPDRKTTIWLSVGLPLFGVVVIFLFLFTSRSSTEEKPVVPITEPSFVTSSTGIENSSVQQEIVDIQNLTVNDLPKLRPLDYPPGSVGEACGVNDFPSREWSIVLLKWSESQTIEDVFRRAGFTSRFTPRDRHTHWNSLENKLSKNALENERCRTALERHVNQINPYLWGRENDESFEDRASSFVVIDNPITFERIFTDPKNDLVRVQEALTRPECQLTDDSKRNWHLNETCHAAAFHNTALVMYFCYYEGTRANGNYWPPAPQDSPERDHTMWIHSLEYHWVKEKCNSLDPMYAELRKQIVRQLVNDGDRTEDDVRLDEELTKLAARLGDDAAGLTGMGSSEGRFAGWFNHSWNDPVNLFTKHPPSVDRLRRLISLFVEKPIKEGKPFVFNHEALVQHLCTPPYNYKDDRDRALSQIYIEPSTEPRPEPPSCREIVNELRQELHDNSAMLELIATFEEVAMRLDVYE
ncbi:MAG: hypothetical protein F4039_09810 [Gammaproteobacteria bacterium]|nr:hypothetical protein [Gammaproteobacteria bacterium]MYK44366.1 hypothetical protein [Gammaproteobacteria bacterium]